MVHPLRVAASTVGVHARKKTERERKYRQGIRKRTSDKILKRYNIQVSLARARQEDITSHSHGESPAAEKEKLIIAYLLQSPLKLYFYM